MFVLNQDVTIELLSIFGALGSAWLVSNTCNSGGRSLFERIFKRRNKITNIYQLLPILQKNSKRLFLLFSDLAAAVKSIKTDNGKYLTRELIKSIVSQDYYTERLLAVQNEVFDEFNVDFQEVQAAIAKFSQDDQVEYYVSGVQRMYDEVLNGSYPQCPGVELSQTFTEKDHLAIHEKVAVAKAKSWLGGKQEADLHTRSYEDIIVREMARFGCDNRLDALAAYRNAENYFSYYPRFEDAKNEVFEKVRRAYTASDVAKLTREELQAIVDSAGHEATVLVLVFDDTLDEQALKRLGEVKRSKAPLVELRRQFAAAAKGKAAANGLSHNGSDLETVASIRDEQSAHVEGAGAGAEGPANAAGGDANGLAPKNHAEHGGGSAATAASGPENAKVETHWVFREDFVDPARITKCPALAVFRAGEFELVNDL